MTPIDPATLSAINQGNASTDGTNQKKDAFGQDAFLTLMVTQLKNQNPLEPIKNQEFLAQLSSFTTASGVQELNQSFGSLSSALQSNQALQASSMVGRKVVIDSSVGHVSATQPMNGLVEIPETVGNLRISIMSPSGALVRTIELGMQAAGETRFSWDGTDNNGDVVPPGNYRFTAEANFNGTAYSFNTMVESTVDSVTLGRNGQGMALNLGGLGAYSLSQIKTIR